MRFFLPSVEFPRLQPGSSRRRRRYCRFRTRSSVQELGSPPDRRIREDVEVVAAGRGELRDDGALRAGPEPVPRVRRDRVLVARAEHDCLALDVQFHRAATAAERLLLTGRAVERRVPVLRARLARVEDELLGAIAIRVDVDEQLQADLPQPAEAEVGDLDLGALCVRQLDARRAELLDRVGLRLLLFLARDHAAEPTACTAGTATARAR